MAEAMPVFYKQSIALNLSIIDLKMRATLSSTEFLFGRTRARLLNVLLASPGRMFYLRQLARLVSVSSGTTMRELSALTREGWLHRQEEGRQVYYTANTHHPAFSDLRGLLLRTSGFAESIASSLAPLAEAIDFAFLFGSFARGEQKVQSDIDLAILGEVTMEEVMAAIDVSERVLGRPINPVVYTLPEVQAKLRDGNHFLQAILKGSKKMLLGDEHELGRLGELRLDRP